jgi:hypothetical protein
MSRWLVYLDGEETRKWSEVDRPCVGGDMDGGVIGRWVAMVESFVFLCVVLCEWWVVVSEEQCQGALINRGLHGWTIT